MITMSLKNKKLLSAEELLDRSETLDMAIDIFLVDNVLSNWRYQRFEKEYIKRLDEHVRERYPQIAALDAVVRGGEAVRVIYREDEESWEEEPQEIKRLRYDKIGILYHLARQDRPSLELADYIAELCD